MSRSINKAILLGNLTRDPELKYTPAGAAVCTFGLATNRTWTTTEGQTKEDVQYHRITAWNKVAELCAKLLTKGRKVYIEGRIVYRSFTGKDGAQRSITEIVLDDFILLDNMRRAENDGPSESASAPSVEATHGHSAPEENAPSEQKKSEPKESAPDMNEKVDPNDIPF